MLHLRLQSIICLKLYKKVTSSSSDVIEIESVYGTLLKLLSKVDLKVQMDAKFGQSKNESKSELLLHMVMHKRVQMEQR